MGQSTGETTLQRALKELDRKVNRGEVAESEAEAIREQVEHETGNLKPGTVGTHARNLSLFAKRSDFDLQQAESHEAVNDVLRAMMSGEHPGVKDDGIIVNNFVSALRKFYRNHDFGVDDAKINVDEDYSGRDLSPDDLLYREDVDDLLAAAQRDNVRDMALIALGLATGQRVDAIRTLRIKHVHQDGPTMDIRLNSEEGSLKGASGRKPLLWAKHYVRPWYEAHPYRDDPEAALFIPLAGSPEPREPINRNQINKMLKRRADSAGIQKDVYPHLLRHSAITRMVAEGLSEQKIKHIVGWDPDSSQFGTYVHLADQIATDSVRRDLGLPTSDTGNPVIGRPTLDTCPSCNDKLRPGAERCSTCQTPLTTREADQGEPDSGPDPAELVSGMDDDEKMELLDALRDEIRG